MGGYGDAASCAHAQPTFSPKAAVCSWGPLGWTCVVMFATAAVFAWSAAACDVRTELRVEGVQGVCRGCKLVLPLSVLRVQAPEASG